MGQKRIYILGGLAFLLLITISFWREVLSTGSFEITFFDVGQGDAAFIRTSRGQQIVIDGGPNGTVLQKLAKKIPFWDKTIDVVILSHPAKDHVAGLLDVLQKYRVGTILWTGVEKDTEIFQAWERAVEKEQEEGAAVFAVSGPRRILLSGGWCSQYMDILSPLEDMSGKLVENDNDTSLVVRLHSCEHVALFTGDLTQKGEGVLLEQNLLLDSDILKVGHHGSRASSSEAFIRAVSPDSAVISSGRGNSYGHPHQETLATLEKYGIEIRRTDEEGDISFYLK